MRLRIAVALVAALATCAGCNTSTAGQATGEPTTSAGISTTSSATVTTTTADSGMKGKTDFTEDEMCDLLTGSEAQQFGGSAEGEPSLNVITRGPLCKWSDATSIVATFLDDGLAERLKSGPTITKTRIQLSGTPAVQSDDTSDGGLCQVGFDLTDHSSLIVGVTVLTDPAKYKRCDVAKQVATSILSKVK